MKSPTRATQSFQRTRPTITDMHFGCRFLRGFAEAMLVLSGLVTVLGLFVLFGGETGTGAAILGAAVGVALYAGILWMLTEVCQTVGNISQVLDDDICEALEAGLTVGFITRDSRMSASPVGAVREAR
jgi:hypothetical protein